MYLLVDVGNSSLKWNVYDAARHQFLHPPQSLLWQADDLAQSLSEAWNGLNAIESVLIANVGGEAAERAMQPWLESRGLPIQRITTESQAFGVRNGYKVANQLGVDRWLAVLAAAQLAPGCAACVISCGTAITVDSVSSDAKHQGGLIVPGLKMMKNTLSQHTHSVKISHHDIGLSPFTDNTSAAVNNGTLLAAIAFVDRAVHDIETRLGENTVKIITGGDAQLIQSHLHYEFRWEPELVLKGLARYADKTP